MSKCNDPWRMQLKLARVDAAMLQRDLRMRAGFREPIVGTQISRNKSAAQKEEYEIAQQLAALLDVPTAYLYVEDDAFAKTILTYHQLNRSSLHRLVTITIARFHCDAGPLLPHHFRDEEVEQDLSARHRALSLHIQTLLECLDGLLGVW